MLSKGSWFTPFLTPVFHVSSFYVSLPSEVENITRRNSRLRRRRSFEFVLLRLELYWQPATIGGDFWCSKNDGCIGSVPFYHQDLVSPRSSCPYGMPGGSP